jgi:1-acyl-sn-glycerol-3-phosphate acyltransferase
MLRKFCSCVPAINDSLTEQTELSQISDEEFNYAWKERPHTWYHRAFQIFCFFLFLGPLRFLLAITIFLIIASGVCFFRAMLARLGYPPEYLRAPCLRIWLFAVRFLFFACGLVYIHKTGTVDPAARFIISNHTAMFDPFVICDVLLCRGSGKQEYRKYFFHHILDLADPIWIDRSASTGVSQKLVESANDFKQPPVLIYPEATLNNGDVILKFHTGAFLTQYPVQMVCVRYWQAFVPQGWNSYAYTSPNFLKYLWGMVSMPFVIVTADILPAIHPNEGESVHDFATRAQLMMANYMKVKAVDRSSDELFKPKAAKKD